MKTGCSWLRRFPLLADLSLMRPSGAFPASRRSRSEPLCRVPYANTWPWVQRLRQQTVMTVITAHSTQRTHVSVMLLVFFSFFFSFSRPLYSSFCGLRVRVVPRRHPVGAEDGSHARLWVGAVQPGRLVLGQTPRPQHAQRWEPLVCVASVCL